MTRKQELIFGIHAVRHAMEQNPGDVLNVWVQSGRETTPALDDIIRIANNHGIHVELVGKSTLDKHTRKAVHQGILVHRNDNKQVAVIDIEQILAQDKAQPALFLVLDGIEDPHNLGACVRTANAAGVDAVLIPERGAVSVTPTVIKVASGAIEHTPVITVTNMARCLRRLKDAGMWIIGTDNTASQSIYDADLRVSLAFVMGAEGRGLRHNIREHCDLLTRLPMAGKVESLNVSVATGVCLFEAVRQRNTGISPC